MRNRLVPKWMTLNSFRGRVKVTSTIALHLTLNISETVRDRGLVPKRLQQEMAYGLSNGHVTDDVTWPWEVKLVTPIRLKCNMSKMAGDRLRSEGPPVGNDIGLLCIIKWSHDRWRHVSQRSWEAVRSAILATAWFLVLLSFNSLFVTIVFCAIIDRLHSFNGWPIIQTLSLVNSAVNLQQASSRFNCMFQVRSRESNNASQATPSYPDRSAL